MENCKNEKLIAEIFFNGATSKKSAGLFFQSTACFAFKINGNFACYYKSYCMQKFCALFLCLLALSCNRSNNSPGNNDVVRKEIKTTFDNYYNDIRKDGLLAELKYLDSSAQFFWVPPGYLNYAGYDSVSAAIRRNAAGLKSIDNRYDSLLVIPLTSTYAQFVVRTVSATIDQSGATLNIAFIESGVMVKRKDGWKFLSGQTSILQ